jgi:type 2 lantibiotic biosynthesis protein LanM
MSSARVVTSSPQPVTAWWQAGLSLPEREAQGSASPAWVGFAEEAVSSAPEHGVVPTSSGKDAERLLPPLLPFVDAARARFRASAAKALSEPELLAAEAGMSAQLGDRLTSLAGRTLVAELRTARESDALTGADKHERFDDFLRQAGARPALRDLLTRYPVLARSLAEAGINVADAAAELVTRLASDRDALVRGLLHRDPGPVASIRFGRGDSHSGGRTVAVVTFTDGGQVVYKPRSPGLHIRWNELLDWFGGLRPELAPRAVALLPGGGYGWAEYVEAAPCRTADDVRAFYRRLGAQLALLYLLSGTDMHCENVIASGAQPVIVDVETLFHPRWRQRTDGDHDPARDALENSVLTTSILPCEIQGEHGRIDFSAFGGRPGARYPDPMPAWADGGTDTMHLVRRAIPYAGGENRPRLDGHEVVPTRYVGELLGGFREAYRTLVARSAELARRLESFATEEIRVVMRPSQVYAALLSESTEPALLTSRERREAAFAALYEETGYTHLGTLAPAEVEQLLAGDIPLFTGRPDSKDIWTAREGRWPELLERDGVTVAAEKARQLGAPDLLRQEWIIEASVATAEPFTGHRAGLSPPEPADLGIPDHERLLELAGDIGDELVARACGTGPRVNWPGLELDPDQRWSVRQMGAALGDGYTGTALFLAELGRVSGIDRYLDMAARAARPLGGIVELLAAHPGLAAAVGPGGFTGVGGICYATARLANLLGDAELARLVPVALAATEAAAGQCPDVADGIAGALMAAHAVSTESGLPEADELCLRLADKLADAELPAEPGFLRGQAGIRYALRLAGRPASAGPDSGTQELSWCSGLAGIVLADHSGFAAGDLPEPVDRFLGEMAVRLPFSDHSLCHGELGLAEALIELRTRTGVRGTAAANRTLSHIVGAIGRRGFSSGTPGAVATPGLLAGLAGVGYGLLRFGFGSSVPSVLLLRPSTPPSPHRVSPNEGVLDVAL